MPVFRYFLAPVVALFLAGCASAPSPMLAQGDPADAQTPVRQVTYRPVTAGYQSQRPVEPRPWREQNDRVAPAR
jgi:starvation-inducible outer membrane lipoprotein